MKRVVNFFRNIGKYFELNWGWIFINGRKQDAWGRYLRKKYGNDEKI